MKQEVALLSKDKDLL